MDGFFMRPGIVKYFKKAISYGEFEWYNRRIKIEKGGLMIRPIIKDEMFLCLPSQEATPEDLAVAEDLADTLRANAAHCVGMAANMIGVAKRIIAVDDRGVLLVLFNPEIIKRSEPYETQEGCLSLTGVRAAKRYKSIKVRYQNTAFQIRLKSFHGWTAQIIQHEIDHCNGIVI